VIRAILFDRDGTLIADNPGNRDPNAIVLMTGARDAVERARAAGAKIGVVTNQPGLAQGTITRAEIDALHARIEESLGPFDGWFICAHALHERCACRKPEPGLLLDALEKFAVGVRECVMIGDIGSDVEAANTIGMRSILVPTEITLPQEIISAPLVARTLPEAVEYAFAEAAAA
jgi:histidinol-phosphate phosphatase family protein